MNIANKLTLSRIFLSFICMGLTLQSNLTTLIFALLLFIIASVTDFLDGYIARKHKIISDLGKILDPIADKLLIIGIFLVFLEKGLVNSWLVTIIMIREFLITGLRMFALRQNKVLEAQYFGKHKTVTQIISILLIYILLIIQQASIGLELGWTWFDEFQGVVIFITMIWVAIITLISGLMYLWKNKTVIRSL